MGTEVRARISDSFTPMIKDGDKWVDPFESISIWSPRLTNFGCKNLRIQATVDERRTFGTLFSTVGTVSLVTFDLPDVPGCGLIWNGKRSQFQTPAEVEVVFRSELPENFAQFLLETLLHWLFSGDNLSLSNKELSQRACSFESYDLMIPLALTGKVYPLNTKEPVSYGYSPLPF